MSQIVSAVPGFIYSGNYHDSIPRSLFFDKRLTPLERNCWIVIKTLLEQDNITAMPSYDILSQYLMMKPFTNKASSETVSKALIVLRLTRWISLVKARRARNGQRLSNLYVIHESPLTPYEAIQIDTDYFSLISRSMDHGSKGIQQVARHTLKEVVEDPHLAGKVLPTRIQLLIQRMSECDIHLNAPNSEGSSHDGLRNSKQLHSDSQAGVNPACNHNLPNPKPVCSSSNNKIHTTIRKTQIEKLDFPEQFRKLSSKHQDTALNTMINLPLTTQQQILNEWHERCQSCHVRKPAAYLLGIIQKAYRGEFNAWGNEPLQLALPATENPTPCHVQPVTPVEQPPAEQELPLSTPKTAQFHIDKIKSIIKRGSLRTADIGGP
ncbi:hypothetical protein CUZ56_01388 [Saezia sanguinis]|uniref:Uncharacterized protein n=1 Tax=Saezia sanguinis TaxID=1965230 RepID=A0A433SFC0_9BURK|nr:STY4528 family pathogenicity island replication protein [Saezia sanguinis]RUS67443.1 hypothetical protein CUZ56_01388 [Saezia sanguinis]